MCPPYFIQKLLKEYPQHHIFSVKGLSSAYSETFSEYGLFSDDYEKEGTITDWFSAMGKMGFIYPEVKDGMGFRQEDLGQLGAITPAGNNLINAETVPAIQNCYLRSMITPIVPAGDGMFFSPLCWVLALMLELEKHGEEPAITFLEMATIIVMATPVNGLQEIIQAIFDLRKQCNSTDDKRSFDKRVLEHKADEFGIASSILEDYTDMNIRYLKATGMVQANGKGIILVPEKHTLAVQLTKELTSTEPLLMIYRKLCSGSPLPTDNREIAIDVLRDLLQNIQ